MRQIRSSKRQPRREAGTQSKGPRARGSPATERSGTHMHQGLSSRKTRLLIALTACLVWAAFGAHAARAADADHDGMPNHWEVAHNLNSHRANAHGDADHDGLSNIGEFRHETLPQREDTDLDGIDDGDEVHVFDSNPTNADEDNDGVADGDEDWDGDGIDNEDEDDALEQCGAADDNDSDQDGLDNEDEDDNGTLVHDADSDNDGILDGDEDNDNDGIADGNEDDQGENTCGDEQN